MQEAAGGENPARVLVALFGLSVVSRLASTIYYIEDTDSLRFALSTQEFSVAKLQPHFPGYPVFCFLVKLLYVATGSFAVAFSLVGAVAVFGILYYSLRILGVGPRSPAGVMIALLVFFNPLMWLMSNRYMPDLLGLACALAAFYYLVFADRGRDRRDLGFFLAGLLAGIRLSYLPLVFVPVLAALGRRGERLRGVAFGTLGVLVWLIPFWLLTGGEALLAVARSQTEGHFTEFGGTVNTDPLLARRLLGLLEGVLADGLGGYWPMRHWITLGIAAGVLATLIAGAGPLRRQLSPRVRWIMAGSWATYLIWILLYQNVIYKSRHVLPLLPFLLLGIALGARELWRHRALGRPAVTLFLAGYAALTLVLVQQHRRPTAIAQVSEHLRAREGPLYVISIPLVHYYLEAQGVEAEFISSGSASELAALRRLPGDATVVMVGDPPPAGREPGGVRVFYHNPYVNRMWSEVAVYEYPLPEGE